MQLVATMAAEDSASTAMIVANNQQLNHLAGSITMWRAKLGQASKEWDQKTASLATENSRLATQHRSLQANSQRKAKQQFLRLKHLLKGR